MCLFYDLCGQWGFFFVAFALNTVLRSLFSSNQNLQTENSEGKTKSNYLLTKACNVAGTKGKIAINKNRKHFSKCDKHSRLCVLKIFVAAIFMIM